MKILKRLILFWAYFIGLGALLGSMMMFVDPSGVMWGMEPLLPMLKLGLPMFVCLFDNFIASGVVLLAVVGVPNFVAAVLTHKRSRFTIASNVVAATMLIVWILCEFSVWGFALPSVLYFIFGVLQLLTAVWLLSKSKKN